MKIIVSNRKLESISGVNLINADSSVEDFNLMRDHFDFDNYYNKNGIVKDGRFKGESKENLPPLLKKHIAPVLQDSFQ